MNDEPLSWQASPLIKCLPAACSAAASIAAVAATILISMNAHRLQKGENTINLIAVYGTEAVRTSRSALYDLVNQQVDDRSARALGFNRVATMRGTLGVVATCYHDGLCLRPTIRDYFCVDVLQFDDVFGSGSPDLARITPDGADIAFSALLKDCREKESER
ncbi:MAG: hypothetical protein OIF40_15140 [Mangrovicoccus sp.]|nr:hypothetical protein [Mangrovicoccus sp.]